MQIGLNDRLVLTALIDVLLAQLEQASQINQKRQEIWTVYHERLAPLESAGYLRRPDAPAFAHGNAHMYFFFANSLEERGRLLEFLKSAGVHAVFHYIPLHSAPAGLKYGRCSGSLKQTEKLADRLVRLPLFADLNAAAEVVQKINSFYLP